MEQALKKLLLAGGIGEQLLDSESLQLLEEVKGLKERNIQAKEALQNSSREQLQLNKDVLHMQEMLTLLQELANNYKTDADIELRTQKDMSCQIEGHIRHQNSGAEVLSHLQSIIDHVQNQILIREREIEEVERTTKVDAHLLQELLDHLSSNEEDNLLLLRYTASDAAEMKKLSVALEGVSEEVANAERHYRECQNESNSCKTVRAHLVSSFLKEAQRRDELLLMWETTLDDLKAKNVQETAVLEDLFLVKSKIASLRQSRNQEDSLLNQIRSSVKEIQNILADSEKDSQIISQKVASVLEASYEIRGQVSELETCRSKLQSETLQLKAQTKTTIELRREKASFLERLEAKCLKLESDLLLEAELLLSSEQSLRALETIKTECERQNLLLEKQISVIKNLKQRHLQEIYDLEENDRTERGLISSCTATKLRTQKDMKIMRKKITNCDNLIYSQDLEIEEVKSRIHQLTHDDNNNPLNEEMKSTVNTIRERVFETSQRVLLLQRTVPLLQSRHFKSQKEIQAKENTVIELEEKASALARECDAVEREQQHVTKDREEFLVDASLSELYLQNRIQKLTEVQDEITKIRENKTEMEKLLKEENNSIRGAISATKTQIRDLEGRQTIISKQMHSTNTKIEQLMEKFNRIRQAINAPEGDIEISPLHVIIEIAKEREGLQEAGDLLDVEVRKAEGEVEGLQKILALLNLENDQFRSKLHHLTYHNEEDEEKANLEEKLQSSEENVKTWNQLYEQESKVLLHEKEHLRETELQLHAVEELLREKNMHVRAVEREMGSQQVKVKHANQACNTLRMKLPSRTLKMTDIELRIIQERLKVVNMIIGDEVVSQPDIADACVLYCQQENVPPPNFSRLTRRRDYGSRSSLGSLPSSKGSEAGRSRTPSAPSGGRVLRHLHSSMTSLNSRDSGSSSVVSGIEEDYRPHSAASVARSRSAARLGADTLSGHLTGPLSAKGRKSDKNYGAKDSEEKEKRLQLVIPDFPKNKIDKNEFRGNKILKRPSFRS